MAKHARVRETRKPIRPAVGVLFGTLAILGVGSTASASADEAPSQSQAGFDPNDPADFDPGPFAAPGPAEIYAPLANPRAGEASGAFGNALGPVIGTIIKTGNDRATAGCTDHICGTSQSDMAGDVYGPVPR